MRNIKFRGKRTESQDWIYGWLRQTGHEDIEKSNGQYIKTVKYYQIQDDKYNSQFVVGETIGQYTGLKDRNMKEIYEGDIVYIIPENETGVVEWENEIARYVVIYDNIITDFDNWYGKDLEIIGNIYDNPELLEEGE